MISSPFFGLFRDVLIDVNSVNLITVNAFMRFEQRHGDENDLILIEIIHNSKTIKEMIQTLTFNK